PPRISRDTIRRPPPPRLFPYTTLFRSRGEGEELLRRCTDGHLGGGEKARARRLERRLRVDDQGRVEDPVRRIDVLDGRRRRTGTDRKSTRLNSSHEWISYAVFCLTNQT